MIHQMLFSAGGIAVSIVDRGISKSVVAPTDAFAGYRLNSNGLIDEMSATSLSWSVGAGGFWLLSGLNSQVEARMTLNSGSALAGGSDVTGSYLALTSTRSWWLAETGTGSLATDLTLDIRDAISLNVLDTAHITLNADAS